MVASSLSVGNLWVGLYLEEGSCSCVSGEEALEMRRPRIRPGLKGNHCNHYQRWQGRCQYRQMGRLGDEAGAKEHWSTSAREKQVTSCPWTFRQLPAHTSTLNF